MLETCDACVTVNEKVPEPDLWVESPLYDTVMIGVPAWLAALYATEHAATPAVDPAVKVQVPEPENAPASAVRVTVPVGVVGLEFVSVTVTVQVL
jgi:hypothetical protein